MSRLAKGITCTESCRHSHASETAVIRSGKCWEMSHTGDQVRDDNIPEALRAPARAAWRYFMGRSRAALEEIAARLGLPAARLTELLEGNDLPNWKSSSLLRCFRYPGMLPHCISKCLPCILEQRCLTMLSKRCSFVSECPSLVLSAARRCMTLHVSCNLPGPPPPRLSMPLLLETDALSWATGSSRSVLILR